MTMMMTMSMMMMMILISSRNPIRNSNGCMVNCSMGPGIFHIFLKPLLGRWFWLRKVISKL